ncbi:MAG: SDR family NAD(P)-dependent oxidoreductase [Planctomycetia bacterium]|nr:SDR family NAD(P)-dependent oxidoreductase [Planctomycetia bacterium]
MSILILSATSDIAQENAQLFLQRNERLILAARNPSLLQALAEKLHAPEKIELLPYDATVDLRDNDAAEDFWSRCQETSRQRWGEPIEGIYVAQGFLPHADTRGWKTELSPTLFLNFTSLAFFLESVARWQEANRECATLRWIAVISSVAADRGRLSNYPYGAAKAGLDTYLSGLRARLFHVGVHVLTIKPGLVRTKMIRGRKQESSSTVVSAQRVARHIDRAIRMRQNIVYTPWGWRWWMMLVRWIPESIFKRLSF